MTGTGETKPKLDQKTAKIGFLRFLRILFKGYVTASCCRSLDTLTEVQEPAEIVHCHRSILPPGVKCVPGPWVPRRILSNRSYSLIANSNGNLPDSLRTTAQVAHKNNAKNKVICQFQDDMGNKF